MADIGTILSRPVRPGSSMARLFGASIPKTSVSPGLARHSNYERGFYLGRFFFSRGPIPVLLRAPVVPSPATGGRLFQIGVLRQTLFNLARRALPTTSQEHHRCSTGQHGGGARAALRVYFRRHDARVTHESR